MPKVTRQYGSVSKLSRKRQSGKNAISAEVETVSLPKEKSKPSEDLYDYSILIVGEKKIGKTTMMQHAPNALFLMFEPGARGLSVYKIEMKTWQNFIDALKLLKKDKKFKTIVVDTVDLAYKLCFEHMCKKMLIEHPQDENDFGKSWGKIEKEFSSRLRELMMLGKGVVFIGHSQEKEVKTRRGEKFDKIVAAMSKQAASFLEGTVDIWGYYGYNGSDRELVIRGDDYISAGCRLEHRFLDAKTGKPLSKINMGRNSKEAYENFEKAFRNEYSSEDSEVKLKKRKLLKKKSFLKKK